MLEERWAMAKWVAGYIDQNSERWKAEKQQRALSEKEQADAWKKMKDLRR